ncbi:Hypothetical protein EAG7_05375 [Klebsiella aerogenes]|nr:Hypothetical protein EAG7_05375 [Klebsiella aerogenes]PVF74760.1 hypothetical protein CSC18_1657 [Klebsiella aerogenes]CCG33930.1 hypothetical protein [Klebsiella aerogenes EA1509E]
MSDNGGLIVISHYKSRCSTPGKLMKKKRKARLKGNVTQLIFHYKI